MIRRYVLITWVLVCFWVSAFAVPAYESRGVGGGGAMSAFSISPYAPLWFVATDMGLVFRSDDAGQSWQALPMTEVWFNSLAYSPSVGFAPNGKTVYLDSGGCNPKVSQDGGITWTSMTGLKQVLSANCSQWSNAIRYWRADKTGQYLFAATYTNLYRSANAGSTWELVSTISGSSVGTFIDNSTTPLTIYHATPKGIYVSTDDGATFTLSKLLPTETPPTIHWLAGGRDKNGITLAFIDGSGTAGCGPYLGNPVNPPSEWKACGFVWVSQNGKPFMQMKQAGGDWLMMAENNSQVLYITGKWALNTNYGTQVWKSTNAGSTWTKMFQQETSSGPWPSDKFQYSAVGLNIGWEDQGYVSFAINPSNANILGGTGYFFLTISRNGAVNWNSAVGQYEGTLPIQKNQTWRSIGLEPTSPWFLKFHPTNPKIGYVGYSDISCLVTEDGGSTWRICSTGYNTTYDFAFDPGNDQIVYAAASEQHDYPYIDHGNPNKGQYSGGVFMSSNRGLSWQRLTPDTSEYAIPFLSVAYDSKNNMLYAGSQGSGVAYSKDGGKTWAWINDGFEYGQEDQLVSQLEIDPANSNVYALLAGDLDSGPISYPGVYLLKSGTTTWQSLRGTLVPKSSASQTSLWRFPVYFVVDWTNAQRDVIWLVDIHKPDGESPGIWQTTNASAASKSTWTQKLEYLGARYIYIDPTNNSNWLIIGLGNNNVCDIGLNAGQSSMMYTVDSGASWENYTPTPAQQCMTAMTPDPNDSTQAFFTSFGGGIYYGPLPSFD